MREVFLRIKKKETFYSIETPTRRGARSSSACGWRLQPGAWWMCSVQLGPVTWPPGSVMPWLKHHWVFAGCYVPSAMLGNNPVYKKGILPWGPLLVEELGRMHKMLLILPWPSSVMSAWLQVEWGVPPRALLALVRLYFDSHTSLLLPKQDCGSFFFISPATQVVGYSDGYWTTAN